MFLLGVQQPEREMDYSPVSSAAVMNEWSYKAIPSIRLDGVDGDKFKFSHVITK